MMPVQPSGGDPTPDLLPYPDTSSERDAWILGKRGARNPLDPFKPYAVLSEEEPRNGGVAATVATVFLTNRECPWRCLICDLWRNTLAQTVPPGAIPAQIDAALDQLSPCDEIKLYNAGSFFDPRAIPPADFPAIGERVRGFSRVIVESHPALIGEACVRFGELFPGRLQIAVGLETIHPAVLPRLNKRMTLEQFENAAAFLRRHDMELRVFVVLKLPFMNELEGRIWAERSIAYAFDCGAEVVTVIPARFGNGAMEALAQRGEFEPPTIVSLEAVLEFGLLSGRGIVLADLWDLDRFSRCPHCLDARRHRLQEMNRQQKVLPAVVCSC